MYKYDADVKICDLHIICVNHLRLHSHTSVHTSLHRKTLIFTLHHCAPYTQDCYFTYKNPSALAQVNNSLRQ
jgi:hypothetical protein